jgi:hypothetical protein
MVSEMPLLEIAVVLQIPVKRRFAPLTSALPIAVVWSVPSHAKTVAVG